MGDRIEENVLAQHLSLLRVNLKREASWRR